MNANERRYDQSYFSKHVSECSASLCSANLFREPPIAEKLHERRVLLHEPSAIIRVHLRLYELSPTTHLPPSFVVEVTSYCLCSPTSAPPCSNGSRCLPNRNC